MAALWSDNSSERKWVISKPCEVFRKKYDDVQDLLQKLSCMDDFLSGKVTTFTCNLHVQEVQYVYVIIPVSKSFITICD